MLKILRTALLTFVFCVQTTYVISQNQINSSKELFSLIVNNTRANPQLAIDNAKKLLVYSKEHKLYDSIAISYLYLAKAGRVKGTYKSSLEYADLGIDFALKNNLSESILAELHLTKANNLADFGKINEALPVLFEGVSYAEASSNLQTKVILNHGLGYIYKESQKPQKAIETLKNNIATIEKNQLLDRKSFEVYYKGMIMLSSIYLEEKQKDSALAYLEEGLKHVLTTDDIFTTAGFYSSLGTIHLDNKNYEEAFKNLSKGKELGIKLGNHYTNSINIYNLAKYYYELGNYDKSLTELHSIIDFYTKMNDLNLVSPVVYNLLAKNYKSLGDFEAANKYFELYVLTYKNSQSNTKAVSVLMQEKELFDLENEKNKEQGILKYAALFISLIALILLIFLLRFYKLKKKNELKFQELLDSANSTKKKGPIDTKDHDLEEKNTADVNEEIVTQIVEGLQKLEEQEYYLKQECNAYNVAKKIKTNTSYLSKVINSRYQKNFNTYVNDLRINYSILRLKNDSKFRLFSIQSIAEELGYKSSDSFTKYFKQHTGLNPSFYIKQLNSLD